MAAAGSSTAAFFESPWKRAATEWFFFVSEGAESLRRAVLHRTWDALASRSEGQSEERGPAELTIDSACPILRCDKTLTAVRPPSTSFA